MARIFLWLRDLNLNPRSCHHVGPGTGSHLSGTPLLIVERKPSLPPSLVKRHIRCVVQSTKDNNKEEEIT
jgi:hypothetical protein